MAAVYCLLVSIVIGGGAEYVLGPDNVCGPPFNPGIMTNTTMRTMPTAAHKPISNFLPVDQILVCRGFGFLRCIDFWFLCLRDISLRPHGMGLSLRQIYHKSIGERGESSWFGYEILLSRVTRFLSG